MIKCLFLPFLELEILKRSDAVLISTSYFHHWTQHCVKWRRTAHKTLSNNTTASLALCFQPTTKMLGLSSHLLLDLPHVLQETKAKRVEPTLAEGAATNPGVVLSPFMTSQRGLFPEHALANIFRTVEEAKQGWTFLFIKSPHTQNTARKYLSPT